MKQRKTLTVMVLIISSVVLLSLAVVSQTVIASNSEVSRSRVISSIEIQCGDTLWDIATQYYTDDYQDITTFVEEIKECNGLVSDTIHEGQYLIIPYFIADSTNITY